MRVADILSLLPNATPLLTEYGLHCVGCHFNAFETLEEGCHGHGFTDETIDDLVTDLNELALDAPARPETLTLTREAALQLRKILESEGKADHGLLVGLDENGAFCMEVVKEPAADDRVFRESHQEGVIMFASVLTLRRIGGATIDYRDDRFKLDLPEDAHACACKDGGECGCNEKG